MKEKFILTENDIQGYGFGCSGLWVFNTYEDAKKEMDEKIKEGIKKYNGEVKSDEWYAYIRDMLYYDIYVRKI